MRGFPDDHHIYDRLARLLAPRHVLAFDWLATVDRASAKLGHSTESRRQQDLNAVIDLLGLEKVVLVGRDASGPEAIDFALGSAEQVAHLVLLNTYYGRSDGLRFPEMIRVFADPELVPPADAMVEDGSAGAVGAARWWTGSADGHEMRPRAVSRGRTR